MHHMYRMPPGPKYPAAVLEPCFYVCMVWAFIRRQRCGRRGGGVSSSITRVPLIFPRRRSCVLPGGGRAMLTLCQSGVLPLMHAVCVCARARVRARLGGQTNRVNADHSPPQNCGYVPTHRMHTSQAHQQANLPTNRPTYQLQATARLKAAEGAASGPEREAAVREALAMLARVPLAANLEYLISQLAYLRCYEVGMRSCNYWVHMPHTYTRGCTHKHKNNIWCAAGLSKKTRTRGQASAGAPSTCAPPAGDRGHPPARGQCGRP